MRWAGAASAAVKIRVVARMSPGAILTEDDIFFGLEVSVREEAGGSRRTEDLEIRIGGHNWNSVGA